MSITQTVLVFVGIPLAVVLTIAALVYGAGGKRSKRYRPGRPFTFTPVWFLSSPDQLAPDGPPAIGAPTRAAIAAGTATDTAESQQAPTQHGPTGGASDHW